MKKLLVFLFALLVGATAVQAEDYFSDANIGACQRQLADMDNGDNMCRLLEALDDSLSGVTTSTGAYDVGYTATGNFDGANVGAALDDLTEVTGAGNTGAQIIGVDVTTVTGTNFNCTTVEGCLVELTAVTGAATTGSEIIGVDATTVTGTNFNCTTVEGCLVELTETANTTTGSQIIGVDATTVTGTNFNCTTVEGCLVELTEVANTTTGSQIIGVDVTTVTGPFDTCTNVEACLVELTDAADAQQGANIIGFDDSGSKTTAATVADALDEVYVNLLNVKSIPITITSLDQPGGAATSAYGNGASDGFSQIGGKEVVFKGDDGASAVFSFALPFDWSTAAWEVHALALGDAADETIDVECWLSKANDIANTDAITTAATALTATHAEYVFVAEDEATYSAANGAVSFQPEAANPVVVTCEVTLGFNNFDSELYAVWIEYTPEL